MNVVENTSPNDEPPQVDPRKRRRVTKACVPCRLSKIKCNGKEPCARCKERDIICMLGTDARSRKAKGVGQSRMPGLGQGNRPQNLAQDKADLTNLLNREVRCSITGSDASASSVMHLHYGPSSTFVFLQQLHRFLLGSQAPKLTIINQESGNYTSEAISEFGYNSVFFGREREAAADSFKTPGLTSQDGEQPDMIAEHLPFDLAAHFLELYLSTIHHLLPLCDSTTLRSLFYSFSAEPLPHDPYSRDSTLVLAVLAMGATLTDNTLQANSLFRQAKANLDRWGDAISLRSVQVSMLIAEFHQTRGRPNSALLTMGATAQKALAIGLHHETIYSDPSNEHRLTEPDQTRVRERAATFWSLYAQDRSFSLFHGRPACINDIDVDIRDPSSGSHLNSAVRLSRISNKVYYTVYGRRKGSVNEFCDKVQGLREELLRFHDSLGPEDRFPLTEAELGDFSSITMGQMIFSFIFFHTMLATLRPCMVLDAVQRQHVAKGDNTTPIVPREKLSWLNDTCLFCSRVAMHLISLSKKAIDCNPLVSRTRHNRYFIESACFVLLFDIVRDPHRKDFDKNIQAVMDGLQFFTRLPADKLISISTSAILRILQLTKDMIAKAQKSDQEAQPAMVPVPDLNTAHLPTPTLGNNIPDKVDGLDFEPNFDGTDFISNDILDMTYDLWLDDSILQNATW